jgi:hypothetical protein
MSEGVLTRASLGALLARPTRRKPDGPLLRACPLRRRVAARWLYRIDTMASRCSPSAQTWAYRGASPPTKAGLFRSGLGPENSNSPGAILPGACR